MKENEENPKRDGRDPAMGRKKRDRTRSLGTGRGSKVQITGARTMSSG